MWAARTGAIKDGLEHLMHLLLKIKIGCLIIRGF